MTFIDSSLKKIINSTIMIVDDEPINLDVVQAFLEEEGYRRFISQSDSRKVVQQISESRVDLLLLDLMMPEIDGFDILKQLRAHPKFAHLPIIILTASTDTQSKLKALELGATDFLAKPLDQSELALRVRNTLYAKGYQDQLAFYDPLTGLPNRQLFLEDFSWALESAESKSEMLALLNVEIDKFDKVNDTIGITAGDHVLKTIAQRIQEVVRELDVLGRAMGDEETEFKLFHIDRAVFALILNKLNSIENTTYVAERVVREIKRVIRFEDREIFVSASIGVATYPTEARDPLTLLKLSSSAKDFAKKQGGNRYQFSSENISEMYDLRLKMESRLRKAIDNNGFVLHYQPKVDLLSNKIVGVESLVRLQGEQGLILPGEFIPIAEETGMVIPMGKWCLAEACLQMKKWQDAGKAPIGMSVNLSARQFSDGEFLDSVKKIILASNINPGYLTLELTESLLMEDIDYKIKILNNLKNLGVKLSIDDFGTGYSSLNYLRKLPLDELKIDRSFVMDVCRNEESQAIVSTIIYLARSLGMSTVAEGIENDCELTFLKQQSCDQYQGFLFCRPVPGEKILELLPDC